MNQTISIDELIEWHGVESLLIDYEFQLCFSYGYYSIILAILSEFIYIASDNSNDLEAVKSLLKILVRQLISHPKPIFQNEERENLKNSSNSLFHCWTSDKNKDLDFDVIFEFSVLMMILLELENTSDNEFIYNNLFHDLLNFSMSAYHGHPDIFNEILYTFLARFDSQYINKVQDELDNCQFTFEEQQLIWQWVSQKMSFLN